MPSSKSHRPWSTLSAVASDPAGGDAPTAADRGIALTLVLVSVCTTALVTARRFSTANRAGLLALAFAALALALIVGRWRRALRMPIVVALSAVLLVVGVARWPRDSTDVWSYAAYGRMVSHYGASPYRHVPVEYSNDRANPAGQAHVAEHQLGLWTSVERDLGRRRVGDADPFAVDADLVPDAGGAVGVPCRAADRSPDSEPRRGCIDRLESARHLRRRERRAQRRPRRPRAARRCAPRVS